MCLANPGLFRAQQVRGLAITKPVRSTCLRRQGLPVQPVEPSLLEVALKQEAAQETGNLGPLGPRAGQPMSDEPENLVLRHLRRISEELAGLRGDMVEVKERLGLLEGAVASLSRRVDRIGGDVEQIKRRLDLVDSAP
jgi:hypothetical protein